MNMDSFNGSFVSYDCYDWDLINELCDDERNRGIVLGDFFCNKRMFQNGVADLILMIKKVLESDKQLIFQAPLYVTSRNMSDVEAILGLIADSNKDSFVIVQDFGTSEMVSKDYNNLNLIWGQLGRVREKYHSDFFFDFLKEKGFYGFETGDTGIINNIQSYSLIPFLTTSIILYKTLGRNCYLKYQTGMCDPISCKNKCYKMISKYRDLEMSIDGYIMGKQYRTIPLETVAFIDNNDDAIQIIERRQRL